VGAESREPQVLPTEIWGNTYIAPTTVNRNKCARVARCFWGEHVAEASHEVGQTHIDLKHFLDAAMVRRGT